MKNLIVNKIHLKIAGFTMMELIVSMIVSSILVALIIGFFLFNEKQYLSFTTESKKNLEWSRAFYWVKHDIETCRVLTGENDALVLVFYDHNIKYTFNTDYIVREKENSSDTFFIKNENIQLTYLEEQINFIKKVKIDFDINGQFETLEFNKLYDNATLLKGDHGTKN